MIMKYLLAILLFSVVVLFHELGHFLFAKKAGVKVNEFSLGLGPTLWGKKIGETIYSIKLLPFGGACEMEGENADSTEEGSFYTKSVWQRFSIVFGGPLFNFIMALVFSFFLVVFSGVDKPVVTSLMDGYPAAEAGMEVGDEIIKMNGEPIRIYQDLQAYKVFHPGEINFTVKRNKTIKNITITPKKDPKTGELMYGVTHEFTPAKLNPINVVGYSIWNTRYWIKTTLESLRMLVQRKIGVKELSGPVGIVKAVGDTVDKAAPNGIGFVLLSLMNFAILLSANLGVVNLLPIPALDGGRIALLLVEAVRKKKLNAKIEYAINVCGLVFLLVLMCFVMINDVIKL